MKNIRLLIFMLLSLAACRAEQTTAQQAPHSISGQSNPASTDVPKPVASQYDAGAITEAFAMHRNLPLVTGYGTVEKVLKDDTNGLKHQKFLLKVSPSITVLIAHNIDLAPRIEPINKGDLVQFKGEYIYTAKGGTIHWTHKDPQGHHQGGWLKHNGDTYE